MTAFRKSLLASAMALGVGLSATAAEAEVTIGVALALSGPAAPYGEQERRGIEAAIEAINAAGGVNGEEIVAIYEDDAGDPRQAVQVANRLVEQGVVAVIGHTTSGPTIPAADIYAEEGIIMITPSATAVDITEMGHDTIFRTCVRDDKQGEVAGNYIAEHFPDAAIAFVHDQTAYGKGLADATKAAVNAAGIEEVAYEAITVGELDYSAVISRLKSAGVEVVYYGGLYNEAGLLLRQMRDQGLDAQFVSGDGLNAQDFWSIVGDASQGVLATLGTDPETNPAAQEVIASLQEQGIDPAGFVLYAYAAVQVWAAAAEKAGSTDPADVAAALHDGTAYPSVLGELAYDEKGDRVTSDYVVYRREGDAWVLAE